MRVLARPGPPDVQPPARLPRRRPPSGGGAGADAVKDGHAAPKEALELTAEQARRFLVRRHFLAPPRALPARAESVLRVVRELGSVQFDPLEVTGARNDDLVFASRIRNYRRAWMERWLYGPPDHRQLFEAYNKSLNILPIEELPVHRVDWEGWRKRKGAYQGLLVRHADVVERILATLHRKGPMPASGFIERRGEHVQWSRRSSAPASTRGWGSLSVPRAVLYA